MTGEESASESFPADGLTNGLVDRWVDGELDDELVRSWLARLDGEPDGWRRLALAFVEAQQLQRACGAIVADVRTSEVEGSGVLVSQRLKSVSTTQTARAARAGLSVGRNLWLATTLVACGMLVGVLGSWLAIPQPRDTPLQAAAPADSGDQYAELQNLFMQLVADSQARLEAEEAAQDTIPVLDVSLGLDEQGKPRRLSLPIAQDEGFPERWLEQSMVTAATRERLAGMGRMIDEMPGVVPVSLPDGRTAVVPVKSLRVRRSDVSDFQ